MGATLPKYFHFSTSHPDKTGLRIISVTDKRTGFTVRTALANDEKQVPAIMAFAGARFSRSALTAEELFSEIHVSKKSAQEKLANIFVNYGHASVGDMAMLFAYIENVPRYLMKEFFYSSALGGGQERSSRYQDFSTAQPPLTSLYLDKNNSEITRQYQALFRQLISLYEQYLPQVTEAYTQIYQPESDNRSHASALQARVFDTVRYFLPAGTNTSGAYITSSREWARLIQVLRSNGSQPEQYLAEQLEVLFAPPNEIQKELDYLPEAPDLIRHTESDPRTARILEQLRTLTPELAKKATPSPKLCTQAVNYHQGLLDPTQTYLYFSLLRLYPLLTVETYQKWLKKQPKKKLAELSNILFSAYDHHHHLPHYAQTGGYTFELTMSLGEAIDFNRHRAWGRFTPFLETQDVVSLIHQGFQLPLYLNHPKLKHLKTEFTTHLETYYQSLLAFAEQIPVHTDPRLLLSLLPNAHSVHYFLSGGPKEISYMTQLRVRPGGHINYRTMAYELAKTASSTDPLNSALQLPKEKKPDPFSRAEFFDRS